MAQGKIQSIRDAEESAKKILADAEIQKASILEKAKDDSISYRNNLVGSAREAAKKALDEVEASREGILNQAEINAKARIAQCDENAENRMDEAVMLIISEIA